MGATSRSCSPIRGAAASSRTASTTGTPGAVRVNPPNATAPSTFIDGTLILGGHIENMVLTYDFIANQGGFMGNIHFDEGTLLGADPCRAAPWLDALRPRRPSEPVRADGYDHQIAGECRIPGPVPATHRTWGALKALYR